MKRQWAILIILLINFFNSAATAQTAGGTILGRVTDQSGAILPGAEITIKNVAAGIMRAVLSNEVGLFNAANLQPGTYEVTVQLPSFTIETRKDIGVNVRREMSLDFQLR